MTTPAAMNLNLSSQKSMTDPFSTDSFVVQARFLALTHLSQRRKFTAMSNPNPLTHEALDDLSNKLQLLFDALKTHFGVAAPPLEMPPKPATGRRKAVTNDTEHNRRSTIQPPVILEPAPGAQTENVAADAAIAALLGATSPLPKQVIETPSGTTTFPPDWDLSAEGSEPPEPIVTAEDGDDQLDEAAHDVNLQVRFLLQANPDGMPMRAIVSVLAKDYAESVVVSSVKHLVKQGDITVTGRKRGTKYHMAPINAAVAGATPVSE